MPHTAGDNAVVNQALANLGHTVQVTSIDADVSTEAKSALLVFDRERDLALGLYRWKWAEKRAVLVESVGAGAWWDNVHQLWDHVYALPADCVVPRILSPGGRYELAPTEPGNDFDVTFDSAGTAKVLVCDVDPVTTGTSQEPLLLYTARVADAALYPEPFKAFFAWCLALALARPLKKDRAREAVQECLAGRSISFRDAWVFDRASFKPPLPPPSPSMAARGASRRLGQR